MESTTRLADITVGEFEEVMTRAMIRAAHFSNIHGEQVKYTTPQTPLPNAFLHPDDATTLHKEDVKRIAGRSMGFVKED